MEECRLFLLAGMLPVLSLALTPLTSQADEKLLNARCGGCHAQLADGGLARITEMRKTPEGWDMTIARMGLIHDVDLTPDERRDLVKYLADTQGLAPSETIDWRYVLERRPNYFEVPPDETLGIMCARCHTYARIALQRRDTAEWLAQSHFHVGQWPTLEYQALGRDRKWWEIATTTVPEQLGKMYPLETEAWSEWEKAEKADLSGTWRVVGHQPGKGAYHGVMTATPDGPDRYKINVTLTYPDAPPETGSGTAVVFTGYEWRGWLKSGDKEVLQVLALSEDGTELSGRWFFEDSDSQGGDLRAIRSGSTATPAILAVDPPYLRVGETATIAIHGVGLDGPVSLGEGVEIIKTVAEGPQMTVVQARATDAAPDGARTISVGTTKGDGMFTVYGDIDSIRVEPEYAIARVGGAGGPLPPVPAQFDAVAYLDGPDGEGGTDDDVRIGVMPATWSVEPFNEVAKEMKDVRYAGTMEAGGLFVPAGAGPNPARRYSTNNAGDLTVRATVADGESTVEGTGHLIVTVQRWNDPPIR